MRITIIVLVIVHCLLSAIPRPAVADQRYTVYAPVVMSSGQMSSVACGEGEGECE